VLTVAAYRSALLVEPDTAAAMIVVLVNAFGRVAAWL
jgi:hypothetical protein